MVPLSRLFASALWLAVTMASTAMVWAATSLVAADVTDRPPTAVAHEAVVSELASGPPPAAVPPTSTTLAMVGSTTTVPRNGMQPPAVVGGPVTTTLSPAAPRPGVTIAPVPVPVPAPAQTPATTAPPSVAGPRPTAPATTASVPSATFSTGGGVVRVACDGFLIDLISAIPNNGYSVKVLVNGPVNIEVHFVRSGQDDSVKAVCFGQPIRYYDQMPPRQTTKSF